MKMMAAKGETAPRAMGRRRVRETCGSRFRSQRSLMVQPAPRITIAPVRKSAVVPSTVLGVVMGVVRGAARRVLKRHGKKR